MKNAVLFEADPGLAETGNKAANLLQLVSLGYKVPEFFVVPVSALNAEGNLVQNAWEKDILSAAESISAGETLFAVRSSTTAEDSEGQSFAGQFRTELFVPKAELIAAIKRVALSANNENVRAYGNISGAAIAVIVQRMVQADTAGVAFGADPVNGFRDKKIITAVWGVGEGLVSGELDADTWELQHGNVVHIPAVRKHRFVLDATKGFGAVKEPLPEMLAATAPLSTEMLWTLAKWLDKLMVHFGTYQDVEFAVENDELYLLQTRPITTLNTLADKSGERVVWDNSNIVESYPGLTLPLTYSFIADVYEAVYKEFSGVMGIRKKRVHANAEIFENMLGLLHGRVYYNLNNWYRALALLPGYSLNARFMEKMMGVKESMDIEIPKRSRLVEIWDILYAVRKILGNLRTANRQRLAFIRDFYAVYGSPRYMYLEGKGTAALVEDFKDFEMTLTGKWKAPLVNDFFCMIYFGLLQKLVKKYAADTGEYLHNDLLAGSADVVSAEPVKLIQKILEAIRKDQKIMEWFVGSDTQSVIQKLYMDADGVVPKLFFQYLNLWGDRTVAELKLETITYKMEPQLLVKVLQMHLQGKEVESKPGNNSRKAAEEAMLMAMRGKWLRKLIFGHVLKKARYFVSNRENLRYERTRGFARVREIFVAIGRNWKAEGILDDARDIFYLRKQEIFDFVKGQSPEAGLKELVKLRKELYETHAGIHLQERIVSYSPVYLGTDFTGNFQEELQTGDLKGIPCSAGMVRARVRIITDPYAVSALNGDIIVTESTDPGWTALFATSGGILVQRGSLLSHAAIVSREMGIPCIVGISGLLSQLKNGDEVIMDGSTGNVQILGKTA